MSFEVSLTAVRRIEAPREVVWQVFSDFVGWPMWNPGVRKTELGGTGQMDVGGAISLELRPLGLPITVKGQVVQAIPGSKIVITGRWLGITGWQTYSFQDMNSGTLVQAHEMLSGWMLGPLHFFAATRKIGNMVRNWLEALAGEAEKRVANPGQ